MGPPPALASRKPTIAPAPAIRRGCRPWLAGTAASVGLLAAATAWAQPPGPEPVSTSDTPPSTSDNPAPPDPAALRPPDQLGAIPIDRLDPERSVPSPEEASRNPLQFGYLLMDLATRAELAEKRGEPADAIRYYRALARAAPHRSIAFGKMCAAHEALGDRDAGLAACRVALGREGVRVEDHLRYVRLLLARSGRVSAAERSEVEAIAAHLDKDPASATAALEVRCQLATRTRDVPLLEACVAGWTAAAPRDLKTSSYRWALALERKEHARALELIEQARAAGLDAAAAERMRQAVLDQRRRERLPILAGVALAVLGMVMLGWRRMGALASRLVRRQPA
jgi:hypothetical protein